MVHGQQTNSVPIGHKYNFSRIFHYLKLLVTTQVMAVITHGNGVIDQVGTILYDHPMTQVVELIMLITFERRIIWFGRTLCPQTYLMVLIKG